MDNINYYVGQKIREMRELRGLTLEDVAREINKSSSTISDYEIGKTPMTLKTFLEICKVLNIDHLRIIAELDFENKIKV